MSVQLELCSNSGEKRCESILSQILETEKGIYKCIGEIFYSTWKFIKFFFNKMKNLEEW